MRKNLEAKGLAERAGHWVHMSYSLNSLKGGYIGDYIGDYYRVIKGDTRSLDYSSYDLGFRGLNGLGFRFPLLPPLLLRV